MIWFKKVFLIISVAVAARVAYKLFKKKKIEKVTEFHEAIMFSYDSGSVIRSKYSRCMMTKSMDRLLHYLSKPQNNLDICMYVLTNMDITNALLKLHYRNIKIRIIVDADMAFICGSGIKRLAKRGIPIRWMKSTNLMHHKFCLVDTLCDNDSVIPFLMTGSLNWTNQALSGNYEDYLVTSQKELVQQYKNEFDRLWTLFKPIVE